MLLYDIENLLIDFKLKRKKVIYNINITVFLHFLAHDVFQKNSSCVRIYWKKKFESNIQHFSKFHSEASPTRKVERKKEPFARLILQNYLNYT